MTPKTIGWDERHLAENPAIGLLQSLGCCRTGAPWRITPTSAGWARFEGPPAPGTGTTGSTSRAAERKCGS